jgi:hypothetical protein
MIKTLRVTPLEAGLSLSDGEVSALQVPQRGSPRTPWQNREWSRAAWLCPELGLAHRYDHVGNVAMKTVNRRIGPATNGASAAPG